MTFTDGLLKDLAELDAFERWRTGTGPQPVNEPEPAVSADDVRRLALLRSELLQLGAVASLLASVTSPHRVGSAVRTNLLGAFTPAISATATASVDTLAVHATYFELAQLWQMLAARLAFANSLSAAHLGQSSKAVTVDIVADAWQRFAATILATHREINALMVQAGLVCDAAIEASTLALLRAAAAGEAPCFEADGELSIPGWAERRADLRIEVDLPVDLSCAGRTLPARLVNISQSGLGIESREVLSRGLSLEVTMPGGRRLAARVIWALEGRMGLALADHLAADDPLLRRPGS
jgi:hypothetical protein